jgi:hypothetical protein
MLMRRARTPVYWLPSQTRRFSAAVPTLLTLAVLHLAPLRLVLLRLVLPGPAGDWRGRRRGDRGGGRPWTTRRPCGRGRMARTFRRRWTLGPTRRRSGGCPTRTRPSLTSRLGNRKRRPGIPARRRRPARRPDPVARPRRPDRAGRARSVVRRGHSRPTGPAEWHRPPPQPPVRSRPRVPPCRIPGGNQRTHRDSPAAGPKPDPLAPSHGPPARVPRSARPRLDRPPAPDRAAAVASSASCRSCSA